MYFEIVIINIIDQNNVFKNIKCHKGLTRNETNFFLFLVLLLNLDKYT